jgi:hypothetical protein
VEEVFLPPRERPRLRLRSSPEELVGAAEVTAEELVPAGVEALEVAAEEAELAPALEDV